YWDGTAGKPIASTAREALFAQARMLHIDSTRVNPGVISALMDPDYSTVQRPLKQHIIPGVVNAADYDIGNQSLAYSDSDVWATSGTPGGGNNGSSYRNDGVDIERSLDPQGYEYNVGWLETFEWMEYTVEVAESGAFRVDARVASPSGGGDLNLAVDGVAAGVFSVPMTGGWQNWTTVTIPEVQLDAGTHVLRVSVGRQAGFNFNRMTFTKLPATDTEESGQAPERPGFGHLYPNPATDEIRLGVHAASGTRLSVDVYDLLGRLLLRSDSTVDSGTSFASVDMGSLPPGTYIVVGTLDDGERLTRVTRSASLVR
ncbi:MAG: carbohydrate-binding protein, partial [Rhodothermales bacterium]|nr:carbohydrate-binding protein [Rhodothermales bacterium]